MNTFLSCGPGASRRSADPIHMPVPNVSPIGLTGCAHGRHATFPIRDRIILTFIERGTVLPDSDPGKQPVRALTGAASGGPAKALVSGWDGEMCHWEFKSDPNSLTQSGDVILHHSQLIKIQYLTQLTNPAIYVSTT